MKFKQKSLLIVIALVAVAAAWLSYSFRANANYVVIGQLEIGLEQLDAVIESHNENGGKLTVECLDEYSGRIQGYP